MPSLSSRERVPGRGAILIPRDFAEEQDWSALGRRILTLTEPIAGMQAAILALQQASSQPQWTIVQESADYEFPACFIRAEISASGGNRVATLPLSDKVQGQLVNVAKSDNSVNVVDAAVQGTDAFFIPAGFETLTAEWDSVVFIAVPGGWSIFARSV